MNTKLAGLALVALGSITAVGNYLSRAEYKTVAAMTYFVDPTGNNSNACTASGTAACATLSGVFAKLPPRILHAITINVAAGSYTDAPSLTAEALANITITGPALANVTPTTGSATGTLTAVSNVAPAVLTDSTQSWTVNELIGRLVVIGGVNRIIATNTATTLTLASIFASTPSVGAAYVIQKQGASWSASVTNSAALNLELTGLNSGPPTVSISGLEFINPGLGWGCGVHLTNHTMILTNSRCYGSNASGVGLLMTGGAVVLAVSSAHGGNTGLTINANGRENRDVAGVNLSNSFTYGESSTAMRWPYPAAVVSSGISGFTAQTNSASASTGVILVSGISGAAVTGGVGVLRCLRAGPSGVLQDSQGTNGTGVPTFFSRDTLYIDGCTTGINFSTQTTGNGSGTVISSLTCNNVTTCISVASGSRFRVPATFTLTGVTNDIQIDGVNYTKANLTGATPTRLPTTPTITGSSVWQ